MISWHWKTFNQLTRQELVDIFTLRQDVFIVEQQCIYQDIDGLDNDAQHLLAIETQGNGRAQLIGYARILAAGVNYKEMAIGRVIVNSTHRNQGLGTQLMTTVLKYIFQYYGNQAIRISAQQHLEKFYTQLGFNTVSAPYDEDGIRHIEMLKDTAHP